MLGSLEAVNWDQHPARFNNLLLGMAPVTEAVQLQSAVVCGQLLNGRPGFLTSKRKRSVCLQDVERWPLIHDSNAIFFPLMIGIFGLRYDAKSQGTMLSAKLGREDLGLH